MCFLPVTATYALVESSRPAGVLILVVTTDLPLAHVNNLQCNVIKTVLNHCMHMLEW